MTNDSSKDYYKWFLLLFLWVAFFLHQGTRQIYNAILPQIQGTFGVDSVKMGIVGTIFTLTYGICAPLSGFASDFLKRKYMVIVGLGVFCTGIFLSGWVSCIGMMIVFYGLLNGAGQAFYYPAACSLLGQLHEKTRATALAIHQTALYAGIVICSCVSGMVRRHSVGRLARRLANSVYTFRGNRHCLGVHAHIPHARHQADYPHAHRGQNKKASFKDAFMVMFRKPAAMSLALGFGMMIYVDCGFKTWMPTFLQEHFHMDAAVAATNAVVWHYAGAFFGVMLGGRITDKLAAKRKTVRFEANIIGFSAARRSSISWRTRRRRPSAASACWRSGCSGACTTPTCSRPFSTSLRRATARRLRGLCSVLRSLSALPRRWFLAGFATISE